MSKKRLARRLVPAALLALGLATMMAGSAMAYVGPVNHIIVGSGSDTTYYLMSNIDSLYNQSPGCTIIVPAPTGGQPQPLDFSCNPPGSPAQTDFKDNNNHNVVVSEYPLGSGNGRRQLCDQTDATHTNPVFIDYARSSSTPAGCTGIHGVAVAREALTWECWPGVSGSGCGSMPGSTKNLTQQQIKDIYTCVVTNWNQVGGANVPIKMYAPQDNAGTRAQWDALVGTGPGPCAIKIEENFNGPIIAAGNQAGAFFPMSSANWNFHEKGDGSALGAIDGIVATSSTIGKGSFPFGRYVYNVFCDNTCPVTHGVTPNYVLDYIGVNTPTASGIPGINHGSNGFICSTDHGVDPVTGKDYTKLIAGVIKANGYVAIKNGSTGGGAVGSSVCRLGV